MSVTPAVKMPFSKQGYTDLVALCTDLGLDPPFIMVFSTPDPDTYEIIIELHAIIDLLAERKGDESIEAAMIRCVSTYKKKVEDQTDRALAAIIARQPKP